MSHIPGAYFVACATDVSGRKDDLLKPSDVQFTLTQTQRGRVFLSAPALDADDDDDDDDA